MGLGKIEGARFSNEQNWNDGRRKIVVCKVVKIARLLNCREFNLPEGDFVDANCTENGIHIMADAPGHRGDGLNCLLKIFFGFSLHSLPSGVKICLCKGEFQSSIDFSIHFTDYGLSSKLLRDSV